MSGFHDENGHGVPTHVLEHARPLWAPWPDETTEELDGALHAALALLTPKQRFVIECRVGWRDNGHEMSQHDIGVLMGIRQQAVSRIEDRALSELRRILSL